MHLEENKCLEGEIYLEDAQTGQEIKPWLEDQRGNSRPSRSVCRFLLTPTVSGNRSESCKMGPDLSSLTNDGIFHARHDGDGSGFAMWGGR